MATAQTEERNRRKPLRLWPGVVVVVVQWLARFGLKAVVPGFNSFARGMIGGIAGAVAIVVWWLFFSRALWSERWGAIVLMPLALGATWLIKHESMGPLWLIGYAVPLLCLAFVAWAVATRRLADGPRRATMVATILLACGVWTLVRTEGITGDHVAEFGWRWAATPEERLLARTNDEPVVVPARTEAVKTGADWPGFRGSGRDGIVRGVRIETNWSKWPPVQLWRRPVGPGWSSFAVRGDIFYTQEQRGADEVVAAYRVSTGRPVWAHRDKARFFESNGGAGPRATPTLSNGRVYTFGATGIVNVLDAANGAVVWSRNAAADTKTKIPEWGFSSSPLVVDDVVIVAASGQLVAYDVGTGAPRWLGPRGGGSYSSPHLLRVDGVPQILLMSGAGATSVGLSDGKPLWEPRGRAASRSCSRG